MVFKNCKTKILLLIIVFVLPWMLTSCPEGKVDPQEIALKALSPLLTKNDPPFDFESSFKTASNIISNSTQNAGEFSSLPDCIKNVYFPLGGKDVDINLISGTPISGKSGNPVYRIQEKDSKEPIAIAKVFPTGASGFAKEIAGISLRNSWKLKYSDPFYIKFLGKCQVNNTSYDIMVMDLAPGNVVFDYLVPLDKANVLSTDQKNEAMEAAKKVFSHLGRALGELNTYKKESFDYLIPNIYANLASNFNLYIEKLQSQDKLIGINTSQLRDYFTNILNKLKDTKLLYGYTHGDAHLGNFLYDEKGKIITFIDLDRLPFSVSLKGEPINLPALDYLKVHEHLYLLSINMLKKEDGDELTRIFSEAYQKAGGALPIGLEREALDMFLMVTQSYWNREVSQPRLLKVLCQKFPEDPLKPSGVCVGL